MAPIMAATSNTDTISKGKTNSFNRSLPRGSVEGSALGVPKRLTVAGLGCAAAPGARIMALPWGMASGPPHFGRFPLVREGGGFG